MQKLNLNNTLPNMQNDKEKTKFKRTGDKLLNRAASACKYELTLFNYAILYNKELCEYMVKNYDGLEYFKEEDYYVIKVKGVKIKR